MILTGKCKEDFTKWNDEREHDMMLPFEYPIYLNALIIEFFDSVQPTKLGGHTFANFLYVNLNKYDYKTSVEQAIKKANCLYNENR